MQHAAHVLIAGADEALTAALELMLEQAGYQTTSAATGPQALAHIRALSPDLVVLETQLPEMSGYEVCQRLRADPELETLPIVMIARDKRDITRRKALALGANLLMTPPIAPTSFLKTVQATIAEGQNEV